MSKRTDTAGKVARLDEQRAARKGVTRARALLERCREQLREHMAAAMPAIMDQVDDALFTLAEKADTNLLQTTYFEAMRSVRLARSDVESRFAAELETAIEQRMNPGTGTGSSLGLPDLDPRTFTLVDEDDLEETLAVKNIAGKIRNVCHEDLFALDRRVAMLLGSPNLEGDDNPLGPEVLSNAARGAVAAMEASLEIRLLVLKLFDRHLTRAASRFYADINDWLVRQGVLPDVRLQAGARSGSRPRRDGGPGASAARDGEAPREGGDRPGPTAGGGWESDHAMAQGGQASGTRSGPGAGGGSGAAHPAAGAAAGGDPPGGTQPGGPVAGGYAGYGSGTGAGAAPPRDQLLGVLEQVMRVGGGAGEAADAPGAQAFVGSLTELQRAGGAGSGENVLRELRTSAAASGVGQLDGLMIDVVAMMFDYILEDQAIGGAMRALIARLQIPVLKVAILDKSFFARRSHPARSFLNALAEYGTRAGGGEDDPVFARVHALVERVLDEFETEVDVFSGALEELEGIVSQLDEEARDNAWSSARVAEERERLAKARRRAGQEVDERLGAKALPAAVEGFLRTHWRHLLGERLFHEGEEGEGWRAAVVTMDRLIWSVEPKREAAARDRLLAMLPFLLEQLKLGMHEIGLGAEARAPFLRALSQLHIAALKGERAPASPAAPLPASRPEAAAPAPEAAQPEPEAAAPTAHEAAPASEASEATPPAPDPSEVPTVPAGLAAFPEPPQVPGARTARVLGKAVQHANAMVWRTAEEQPQCQGMGATLVAVKLEGERLVCAHAGDSRLYRLRDGALEPITRDHTYRQESLDRGLVDANSAAAIASNLITRAVGGNADIEVEVNIHTARDGDLYLACSDGLSDMIDDAAIAALMTHEPGTSDLDALARALIDAANAAGGRDNVSVGLLRLDASLDGAGDAPDYADRVSVHAATDPGRRRAHNEDCVEADAALGALVLADGMGGHNAGEVASAMTVRLVMEALAAGEPRDEAFDFDAINAEFWDAAAPDQGNEALYEAVAQEVEQIVLSSGDDLDACFDIDGDGESAAGAGAQERDPLLERVLLLAPGTWVEFGGKAGNGVRARLSWVGPQRTRFLFTDRFGQKVSESTPHGLALELRRGRLRVLDSVPLFDRVVSRLSRSLRAPGSDGEEDRA